MDVLVYDEQERRYLPLIPAALLAGISAVLAAAIVLLFTAGPYAVDPAPAASAPPTSTPVAPASDTCRLALERADEALDSAGRVRDALAAQTSILNDLQAQRVEPRAAVQEALPSITRGSRDSLQLDVGRQRYDQAAEQCRSIR